MTVRRRMAQHGVRPSQTIGWSAAVRGPLMPSASGPPNATRLPMTIAGKTSVFVWWPCLGLNLYALEARGMGPQNWGCGLALWFVRHALNLADVPRSFTEQQRQPPDNSFNQTRIERPPFTCLERVHVRVVGLWLDYRARRHGRPHSPRAERMI